MDLDDLADGTSYTVQMRSHNAVGVSEWLTIGFKNHTTNPPEPMTLIKNTGQTNAGTFPFNEDMALPFTTGSNSDGYTLTSVAIQASFGNPGNANSTSFTVTIHPGSGTSVGSSVGTLTSQALTSGTNTFTSSDGHRPRPQHELLRGLRSLFEGQQDTQGHCNGLAQRRRRRSGGLEHREQDHPSSL